MSIELTTASKSTRLGVLSALNSGILGVPSLDGYPRMDQAEVVWADEATEGVSIPDGASDTFTKTYNLTRSYPNGAYVLPFRFSGTSFACTSILPFPKIAQAASLFPYLSANISSDFRGMDLYVKQAMASDFSCALIFVTDDYTQAIKLHGNKRQPNFPTPLDENGNQITDIGFGKNYSQLNNFLVGYYAGPFGGGNDDSYFLTVGTAVRFVLRSAYLDGTSIKFLFKKTVSSSSAELRRVGILIVDANV
jgi:hypothetical protein